ncbi:MAG: Uma2 family endonuclease [Gemmatales bacterium]
MITTSKLRRSSGQKSHSPPWERKGDISFTEFCATIHDGQKADLLHGVIHLASPDNTDNSDLQSWLQALLYEFIKIYSLGKLYTSRVAFRLNKKNGPEPDIAFVSTKNLSRVKRGYVEGPPDLAVEIVSPESAYRDYKQKRELYESSGVLEYWIIDPEEKNATFLVRKGSRFVEAKPVKLQWNSQVLSGLSFDVRWLWTDHRPSIFEVLKKHYYPETSDS